MEKPQPTSRPSRKPTPVAKLVILRVTKRLPRPPSSPPQQQQRRRRLHHRHTTVPRPLRVVRQEARLLDHERSGRLGKL